MSFPRKNRLLISWSVIFFLIQILGPSTHVINQPLGQIRAFTRAIEFDYVTWTIDTVIGKIKQGTIHPDEYLNRQALHDAVT
ncbi:MAG: hypothetical protein N2D54_04700, partial [Chloroflexota bacterium]